MASGQKSLKGRRLYIPPMATGSARATAAVFRSAGIDALPTPPSNERTIELGSRYTSGDECYPEKVTLGDFLRVAEEEDFVASKTAFLMPTATGPCRFGQYAELLESVFEEIGAGDVYVFSPSSRDGYEGIGTENMERAVWRGLVAADALRKMLLRSRPYETNAGDMDTVYEEGLARLCDVLEKQGTPPGKRLEAMVRSLAATRERFRAVPARYEKGRPLVGIVGEIFCRLNRFSNEDLARNVEKQGGETWLSDIAEWVWYTNSEKKLRIRDQGVNVMARLAKAKVKEMVQRSDEHALMKPFEEDFVGIEEPEAVEIVLEHAAPYLPQRGALGEMVLSVGKSVYLQTKGADGVIDISPFSCMNGIVCEAVYPRVSEDHDGMPIRNFYFDGTQVDLEQQIGIFLELARSYQGRKKAARRYPSCFK
jgi:predicted nucleotide-binding protein (sugar kinase/HSP70/actin superfamily)